MNIKLLSLCQDLDQDCHFLMSGSLYCFCLFNGTFPATYFIWRQLGSEWQIINEICICEIYDTCPFWRNIWLFKFHYSGNLIFSFLMDFFVKFIEFQNSTLIFPAYGLDGPGLNPGGGEIFRTCPDRPWGPPSLLYNGYRVFPGGKVRPGRDADLSPPSSAEVKNRVELYLYSP
jgi:hypothetical protein